MATTTSFMCGVIAQAQNAPSSWASQNIYSSRNGAQNNPYCSGSLPNPSECSSAVKILFARIKGSRHSYPLSILQGRIKTPRFGTRCSSGDSEEVGTSYSLEIDNVQQAGGGEKGKSTPDIPLKRSEALRSVDECLREGRDEKALEIVRTLQGRKDGLRGFGAARQVPQRIYTLDELRLNKIETALFLSPSDTTLGAVRRNLLIAAATGVAVLWLQLSLSQAQLLGLVVFILFLGTADQVGFYGAGEGLLVDTLGRRLSSKYRDRVAQHEAGHFLVSYLLGVLPRGYTLSSLDALLKYGASNVQAGTTFVDNEFQEEVRKGRISSGMLNQFTCIALAGVAVEYLKFERAEGGLSDIQQLDGLLTGLGFTQKKADAQVRWAVLNTVTILRRHMAVHDKLARSMDAGKSVGECIEVIERELATMPDL